MTDTPSPRAAGATELRVLEAVKACCERWGVEKVTIDDIARESGVSRATLYRMFPGGKDVLFEAHRVHELDTFFARLLAEVQGTTTLEDLLARTVSVATRELRNDEHLARMLATEPGAVLSELTVDGLPRILRVANAYLVPLVDPYLPRRRARDLIDVVARLVISHFLAPSDHVDLADEDAARTFIRPFLRLTDDPLTDPSPTTGARP
ncbi:MAG: TetR/AcrR family transcriptional regulator [Ilumatobacteraceae bacterium]